MILRIVDSMLLVSAGLLKVIRSSGLLMITDYIKWTFQGLLIMSSGLLKIIYQVSRTFGRLLIKSIVPLRVYCLQNF